MKRVLQLSSAILLLMMCCISKYAMAQAPVNNEGNAAILVPTNGSIDTTTNKNADDAPDEPYPGFITNSGSFSSVWYKFVAPSSGFVRICVSTAGLSAPIAGDEFALFSVTDSSKYSTYKIITANYQDFVVGGAASYLFANRLVPGKTYYVAVYNFNDFNDGDFTIAIEPMTTNMLSPLTDCNMSDEYENIRGSYTGWLSFTDGDKLVGMVRNTGGTSYNLNLYAQQNINTQAIRDLNNTYFMDRNVHFFSILPIPSADLQLFFSDADYQKLKTANPAVTGLSSLNVVQDSMNSGYCYKNFSDNNSTYENILYTESADSANGVDWIQASASELGNFYIYSAGGLGVPQVVNESNSFITVYPNPVKQNVTIAITGKIEKDATLEIYEITGKLMHAVTIPANNMEIDMSNYASGIYFVKYKSANASYTTKLTKD